MNKIDVLQRLFETRASLTQLIIHVSPPKGDDAAAQTMEDLIHKREQVTGAIAQVISADVKATGDDVGKACLQLSELNKQLSALQKTIEDVKTGLSITAQVLNVIAQVVGAVL